MLHRFIFLQTVALNMVFLPLYDLNTAIMIENLLARPLNLKQCEISQLPGFYCPPSQQSCGRGILDYRPSIPVRPSVRQSVCQSVRLSGFNNFKSFSQNFMISHKGLVLTCQFDDWSTSYVVWYINQNLTTHGMGSASALAIPITITFRFLEFKYQSYRLCIGSTLN